MIRLFPLFILFLTAIPSLSQNQSGDNIDSRILKKINFNLDDIDDNGMIGPLDGKRNFDYEFCIPLDKAKMKKIKKIDRSVQFFNGPSGRSACSGEYLCIGSGATKKTLLKLARLDYIKIINPCYYE